MFIPMPMALFIRDALSEMCGGLLETLVNKKSNFFGEKSLSLSEDELMKRMRSEIEKQAAINKNEYLQSDISRLLSQQNELLAAFLQYVNESQNQLSVTNGNHIYRFALPASNNTRNSVAYPIEYVNSADIRIPIVLILERCSLDSNCLDYNTIATLFLNYIRSSRLKKSADLMVCSCNSSGPDLSYNLMPVIRTDALRLNRKNYDYDGESLGLARQAFEQAKSFYGSQGMRIKPPAFFYLTQCNDFSSDSRLQQEITSMHQFCKQNNCLFSVVDLDKYPQVNTQIIVNREGTRDVSSAAYSMVDVMYGFYKVKMPARIVLSESNQADEAFDELSVSAHRKSKEPELEEFSDGFSEMKATKRRYPQS